VRAAELTHELRRTEHSDAALFRYVGHCTVACHQRTCVHIRNCYEDVVARLEVREINEGISLNELRIDVNETNRILVPSSNLGRCELPVLH
jgi:hypothetical protein